MHHEATSRKPVRPRIGLAITLLLSMMPGAGLCDAVVASPQPATWVYPFTLDEASNRDPVTDGDTLRANVDVGFRITLRYAIRVSGIDTPEIGTEAGKQVREVVRRWLHKSSRPVVQSVAKDKYEGRFVGLIYNDAGESLSGYLLTNGLAKPYDGGRKLAWSDSELAKVVEQAKALLATDGK